MVKKVMRKPTLKTTRVFAGKRYVFDYSFRSKRKAMDYMSFIQKSTRTKRGFPARLVKRGNVYDVFVNYGIKSRKLRR